MENLHQIYPPDKLQSQLCIISFQESLIKLNKNNIKDTSYSILQTPLISHPDLVQRIAFDIFHVSSIRPGHIPYLVDVVKYLIDNQSPENSLSELRNYLIPNDIPNQRWYRSFLINCIIKKIITVDEFMNLLTSYQPGESIFLLFCWFAPLIQSHDEEVYENIRSCFMSQTKLSPELNFFKTNFSKMEEKNWQIQRIYFQNGYNNVTIPYYIKNDKPEKLMEIISFCEFVDDKMEKGPLTSSIQLDEKFDYNQRIETSLFERYEFIRHHPTLLQFAAFFGAKKCFSLLLTKGADPTIKDDEGKNLIQFVVAGGNMKIFNICKDIDKIDFTGSIQTAVEFFRFNMMVTLINHLEKDEKVSKELFPNIIHYAARYNNVRALFYCIENGYSINSTDVNGRTPLHYAAQYFQSDTLYALIDAIEIDVNAKDKKGKTPLHFAAKNNKIDSIPILAIRDDFDFNSCDLNGNNAVINATKNGCEDIVYYLLSNDIDVNHRNSLGLSPLHFAVTKNQISIVNLLLTHNDIDPNIKDEKGI